MKKATTADRLKEVMTARNLRQVDILQKAQPFCDKYGIKLGKNDLSQYVNGKVEPGQEKLTILGLALDVSEAWLMGYDTPQAREHFLSEASAPKSTLTEKDGQEISDEDLRAAFFDGYADDLPKEEIDALWNDAREYAMFKAAQKKRGKSRGQTDGKTD